MDLMEAALRDHRLIEFDHWLRMLHLPGFHLSSIEGYNSFSYLVILNELVLIAHCFGYYYYIKLLLLLYSTELLLL